MEKGKQEAQKPAKDYFVLHRKHQDSAGQEKYGAYKGFYELADARKFAALHLPAVVARNLPLPESEAEEAVDNRRQYVAVGKYSEPRYSMGDFDGYVREFRVKKGSQAELERMADSLHSGGAEKVKAGVELKLL